MGHVLSMRKTSVNHVYVRRRFRVIVVKSISMNVPVLPVVMVVYVLMVLVNSFVHVQKV